MAACILRTVWVDVCLCILICLCRHVAVCLCIWRTETRGWSLARVKYQSQSHLQKCVGVALHPCGVGREVWDLTGGGSWVFFFLCLVCVFSFFAVFNYSDSSAALWRAGRGLGAGWSGMRLVSHTLCPWCVLTARWIIFCSVPCRKHSLLSQNITTRGDTRLQGWGMKSLHVSCHPHNNSSKIWCILIEFVCFAFCQEQYMKRTEKTLQC